MRVFPLRGNEAVYSCTSYLILGAWNRLDDVNTLVDTGSDGSVLHEIQRLSTGFAKNPVERVILTHEHFDHVGGVEAVRRRYGSRVCAFRKGEGVDEVLADGQVLRLGDRDFEVLHTPGHSQDSICLYCPQERALFSGDLNLRILTSGGSYSASYVEALERVGGLEIDTLYPGHGAPVVSRVRETLFDSLHHVHRSETTLSERSVT